jgi:hypothetical protein
MLFSALSLGFQQAQLRLKDLELPVISIHREVLIGAKVQPLEIYGLYVDNYQKMWDELKRAPINFDNVRIGTLSVRIRKALIGSQECLEIDAQASRAQKIKFAGENLEIRLQAQRHWFVTERGRILSESYQLDAAGQVWTMEANYDKDTYSVVLVSPDRGKRSMGPIHPAMPMEELANSAFRPIFRLPNEMLLKEKTYYLLDPFTGTPVKQSVKSSGPFGGVWGGVRYTGQDFEFIGGPNAQKASLTKQGWLMKIALEKFLYLHIEEKPAG